VPGVIDKDRCSAELALAIGADVLVLLTGVPRVALGLRHALGARAARDHGRRGARGLADGEFPAGSMGPKIESAERFVPRPAAARVITSADQLVAAVDGRGRHVDRAPRRVPA
jgi:carbamate kinase